MRSCLLQAASPEQSSRDWGLASGEEDGEEEEAAAQRAGSVGMDAQLEAARRQGLLLPNGEIYTTKLGRNEDYSQGTRSQAPPPAAPAAPLSKRGQQREARLAASAAEAQQREAAGGGSMGRQREGSTPGSGQGDGGARIIAAKPAAQPQASATVAAPRPPAKATRAAEMPRFVRWEGDWMCKCGAVNGLTDRCSSCRCLPPCRYDWLAVLRVLLSAVDLGLAASIVHSC